MEKAPWTETEDAPQLGTIPYFGPVRIALLLATIGTPWRFRTKRNLWAYAGLAVVTVSSADYEFFDGRARRRQRPPLTRGLNRNHNRVLKAVFKGAATTATGRAGPLQDLKLAPSYPPDGVYVSYVHDTTYGGSAAKTKLPLVREQLGDDIY